MQSVERTAMHERITQAIEDAKAEGAKLIASNTDATFVAGARAMTTGYVTRLEGLRQFADGLDVREAELFLADVYRARNKGEKR